MKKQAAQADVEQPIEDANLAELVIEAEPVAKPVAKKAAVKVPRIPKAHTKSIAAKVRYLDSQGVARADIARALNVRYQRVRNVLVPRVAAPVQVEELDQVDELDDLLPVDGDLVEMDEEQPTS